MRKNIYKPKQKKLPNHRRAIIDGTIATVYQGKRIIKMYKSGEPLQGRIQ